MPHTAYIVEAVRTATGKKKGACGVRGERRAARAGGAPRLERTNAPLQQATEGVPSEARPRARLGASDATVWLRGVCVMHLGPTEAADCGRRARTRPGGALPPLARPKGKTDTNAHVSLLARHQPARGAALARAKGAGWCPQTLLGAPVARGGDRRAGGRPVAPRALHQVGVGVQRRPRAAGAARGAGARPAPHAHASPQPTITSASQPLLTHARPPPTRPHARAAVPATTRQGACPTSTPPTWAPRWWMRCWTARGSTPRWWTTLFSDASRRWVGAARLARRCALVPEVAQLKTASVAA